MRKYFIVAGAVALIGLAIWVLTGMRAEPPAPESWQLIRSGKMAEIEVEKTLYRKVGEAHFFIHVRIRNTTDRAIGIDVRDYSKVVYPNQWGALKEEQRGMINESRVRHAPLDDTQRAELLKEFKANRLTAIAPGQVIDYFREFNAREPDKFEKQTLGYRFLFISLDGVSAVTDGEGVEQISCAWEEGNPRGMTDLIIPVPIAWKNIPAGGNIVRRR